jgi:hypothetical protein
LTLDKFDEISNITLSLTREIELLRGEAIRLKQRAETAEVLT